ncbi:MAG: YqgE/AlgH family protein [Alphaproteobacteria bacterium]
MRLTAVLAAVAVAVLIAPAPTAAGERDLVGRLLVSQAGAEDPNFTGTVVLMVSSGPGGALGLVVNQPVGTVTVAEALESLGRTIQSTPSARRPVRVLNGGPVERREVFVVHTPDYATHGTVAVGPLFAVTESARPLEDVVRGGGPRRFGLAFGYAGWAPGQLEEELMQRRWAVVEPSEDAVFGGDDADKWHRAWSRRGTDL